MPRKQARKWDEAGSAGENARAQLPAAAGAYFREGRKLLAGSPSPDDLHGFRLKTKRLRYTLELFRACYSSPLEQRLEALREVQTLLGDLNDCVAAERIASNALPPKSQAYVRIASFVNARGDKLVAAFRKHWKENFDAPGREDWWVGYLAKGKFRAPRRTDKSS
jgi:CHAD domain-containing protein